MKKVIGIGVILQTPQGKFLLQERDEKAKLFPEMIAPFGGGLEEGEDALACAKREMLEELNLELNVKKLKTIGVFESQGVQDAYIQLFIAENIDSTTLELREGKSIVELSKKAALDHPKVTDFTKEVLRCV